MSGKEFLIGFSIPPGLKTRDKLELGGEALDLQEGTGPVFKEASEISQGTPDPGTVKKEDERLLAQLNNILGVVGTPDKPHQGNHKRPRQ